MKNYRLKKEAVQYFNESIAAHIEPITYWQELKVDIAALEEVEPLFLTYGHRENNSNHLAGWDNGKGSHFHFTINFPSVQYSEHDGFSNGKTIRELMNIIQDNINYFYTDFVNKEDGSNN